MLSDAEFDAAMKSLADAGSLDELHDVANRIVASWPRNAAGRNKAQWDKMSGFAKARMKEINAIENKKILYSSTDLDYDYVDKLRTPAPQWYRDKKVAEIKAMGGQVQDADEHWKRHLRANNAWASTIDDTAIIPEDATRGELSEEAIHVRQNIGHLNDDLNSSERTAVNEYLAHVELLEIAEKEGFTSDEIMLLEYNKDIYYKDVIRLGMLDRVESS